MDPLITLASSTLHIKKLVKPWNFSVVSDIWYNLFSRTNPSKKSNNVSILTNHYPLALWKKISYCFFLSSIDSYSVCGHIIRNNLPEKVKTKNVLFGANPLLSSWKSVFLSLFLDFNHFLLWTRDNNNNKGLFLQLWQCSICKAYSVEYIMVNIILKTYRDIFKQRETALYTTH